MGKLPDGVLRVTFLEGGYIDLPEGSLMRGCQIYGGVVHPGTAFDPTRVGPPLMNRCNMGHLPRAYEMIWVCHECRAERLLSDRTLCDEWFEHNWWMHHQCTPDSPPSYAHLVCTDDPYPWERNIVDGETDDEEEDWKK